MCCLCFIRVIEQELLTALPATKRDVKVLFLESIFYMALAGTLGDGRNGVEKYVNSEAAYQRVR